MNKKTYLVLLSVLCLSTVAFAQNAPGPVVPKLVSQTVGGLVRLEFTVDTKIVSQQKAIGLCICIDAKKSIFITRDVPGGMPQGELTGFTLITSGIGGKRIKAELLGIDPETGLAFVRATEKHKWSEIRFARTSNLQLGQRVISVGLLGPQTGNTPYVGSGIVSAVLRLPHQLVYVSGGDLTVSNSPVLTEDGRVIGIVGKQVPMEYRMVVMGRGGTNVGLAGLQTSRFFTPVEEFIGAIPWPGKVRRLSWMGVMTFHPVLPEQREVKGLGKMPAVVVGKVIDGSPAARAGLKQSDAVVGFQGKPLEEMAMPVMTVIQFQRHLARCRAGQKISLTIVRKAKQQTVQVKLAEMPVMPHEAKRHYDTRIGIIARDLVFWDRHAGSGESLKEKGVFITSVRRDSPAARGKLRPGDLLTEVNKTSVPSVAVLRGALEALAKAAPNKPINFIIQRSGELQSLSIPPPQ